MVEPQDTYVRDVENATDVLLRFALFDKVRRKRASRIQILSTVRIGKEKEVEHLLQEHAKPGVPLPTTFEERTYHDFRSVSDFHPAVIH